jgi:hypothetical protein
MGPPFHSQEIRATEHRLHWGSLLLTIIRSSSHFTFRIRHVRQPAFYELLPQAKKQMILPVLERAFRPVLYMLDH